MRLLFASAEIFPFAKTGGLADVAQALPRALDGFIDVYAIMPLYDFIDRAAYNILKTDQSFEITLNNTRYPIKLYKAFNQGVTTLFVYEPTLCGRLTPYGDDSGDYPDNDIRFALFSRALVSVADLYEVDILHINDWHTSLAALYAREEHAAFHTVFTIHNLAFQGIFPRESMQRIGLSEEYFNPESLEFWGQMNCMKAGISYSDIITTVSPRYAGEILEPGFGCGLDGFLRVHQHKLYGILNGIDTVLFDPEHDSVLPCNYGSSILDNKKRDKNIFCETRGFKNRDYPLFIFIGRFTRQKGIDIIIDALPTLLKMRLNISIVGEGHPATASILNDISSRHQNLSLYFGYRESLSHQMYAAADFLLMPSSFEPCGLNQLIALRYGTIPIVNRVGGLYDTVEDLRGNASEICGKGLAMKSYDRYGLTEAVKYATALYEDPEYMDELKRSNMQCDVSFQKSAEKYLDLYRILSL